MDILSYILAKKYTNKIAASGITSVTTEEDSEGNTWLVVVYNTSPTPTTIRYKIPTITGRGISSVEITEDYKLKITYSDGTTWTSPQSIRGPKGDKGDKGDPGTASVSVSATGTSTNDVRYITIDGAESRFASVALREMKAEWKGTDSAATNITTATAASRILSDPTVIAGDGFLGTVKWKDLPSSLQQAEVKAFVLKKDQSQQIVQFECTSSSASPYAWFFNSYSGQGWQSYVPLNNTVTSTSTTAALTANMGKNLQDQITNLQNIGRFLSIWDATTGLPTTEPTVKPYTYRTGDYYRVGNTGGGRYIHQITMAGNLISSMTTYSASFGFIDGDRSACSNFAEIGARLYSLGYKTMESGVECSYTIGSTTRTTNSYIYCPWSDGSYITFVHYDDQIHDYVQDGTISSNSTLTCGDTVNTAYIHAIDVEGEVAGSNYYIDHLTFPSTVQTPYNSIAEISQVLQRLNYSAEWPCSCGGQVGMTHIYFCYGSGNSLNLVGIDRQTVVATVTTSTLIYDNTSRAGVPNYKPVGTTYDGTPSSTEELEDLDSSSIYYFDGTKWLLQKSGGVAYSAGNGIRINNNTISTKIGDGLKYSDSNIAVNTDVIQSKLTAGTNITFTDDSEGNHIINSADQLPAYPADTTKTYILGLKYENGAWVKHWAVAEDPTADIVGVGQVDYMTINS